MAKAAPVADGQFLESTADYPIFVNPQKGKVGVSTPTGTLIDIHPGDYVIGKHFADQARSAMGKGLRIASGPVPRARIKDPMRMLEQMEEKGAITEHDIRGVPTFSGKTIEHWKKYFASVGDDQSRQDFDRASLLRFFTFSKVKLPMAPDGSTEPTREAMMASLRAWAKGGS